ncbi:hypothetical protein MAUB1S_01524 [Mycolicibacterium aubagnense]
MTNPAPGGVYDPNTGSPLTESSQAVQQAIAQLRSVGAFDQAADIVLSTYTATAGDATHASAFADLDADTSHTNKYLLEAYATRYKRIMAGLASKLTAAAVSATAQDRQDASAVFGVAGLPGDAASLAISLRDAQQLASLSTNHDELQRKLAKAIREGDDVLARAIASQANDLGYSDLLNQFAEAYPALQPAITRLTAAAGAMTTTTKAATISLAVGSMLAGLKPPALQNLSDYEIDLAAQGNLNPNLYQAAVQRAGLSTRGAGT